MFADCPNFNGDVSVLGGTPWTDVREMFRNAKKFNQDISHWNVNNVNNGFEFGNIFNGASSFNQNVSSWCGTKTGPTGGWSETGMYSGSPLANQPAKQINMDCREPTE